ncbi:MAG: bifunctional nuclease family protein [Desulfovibrio sp.]|nr:bifunctional nuclease family protein [Desulfovibrio sp.]
MVEMRVLGLTIDPQSKTPMAVLREKEGDVVLPVWIGALEAMSVSMALNGENRPRPLPHDLLLQSLNALDACLDSAAITDLKDGVYRAHLVLQGPKGACTIACRPSDAITLSLRAGARLLVSRQVMERSAAAQSSVLQRLQENAPLPSPPSQVSIRGANDLSEEKYRQMLRTLEPVSPRKM